MLGLEVQAGDPRSGTDGLHPGNARLGTGVALMRLALAGILANGSRRSQNNQVKRCSKTRDGGCTPGSISLRSRGSGRVFTQYKQYPIPGAASVQYCSVYGGFARELTSCQDALAGSAVDGNARASRRVLVLCVNFESLRTGRQWPIAKSPGMGRAANFAAGRLISDRPIYFAGGAAPWMARAKPI